MENATEDVGKFASGTTIGKLIKEIIEPVRDAHAASLIDALAGLSDALSAEGNAKDANLQDIDSRIAQELAGLFPGVSAKTHIPTPEIDDLFKSATIKLFEADGTGRDAASLGHGAQRSVQLALLKTLARIRHEAAAIVGRTTLLLIDEPELYLHPQAVEIIRASLCSLADDGYQVLFTTHSPLMIARSEAENAILVRRTDDEGTIGLNRFKEAVAEAIEAGPRQAEILFSLTNAAKILFAERVFLAEGLTERTLIPEIFKRETGSSLEELRSTIIDLESVDSIIPAMRVLRAMGLPCKALVDIDFIFRGAVQHSLILAEHEDLVACKAVLLTLAEAGEVALDESGLPKRGAGKTAAQAFEHLARHPIAILHIENLHAQLKEHDVWCWKSGAIEVPLGLASKKPSAHLHFINSMTDPQFEDNTPHYGEVKELIQWLIE